MIFPIFLIFITTQLANAQDQQDSSSSNFQPSLFVVIGVLSFMFTLTFFLLLYAKFCHRSPSAIHHHHHNNPHDNHYDHHHLHRGMFGTNTRFSGLDKTVVESLPFFRFSSLKGTKQGLQCAVCLAEFGEIEILRLLPKCKHGFHINCIDQWLENHSSCPLCRQKITAEDLTMYINSTSMRLIGSSRISEEPEEDTPSIIEREQEEDQIQRSSKFSIGNSFRKIIINHPKKDEQKGLVHHRLNHQIVVSDVVFKNRWSNVSSSDLMFLNSEMLGVMSTDRFYFSHLLDGKSLISSSSPNHDHYRIMNIKDEMERKIMFEHKVGNIKRSNSISSSKMSRVFEDSKNGSSPCPRRSSSMVQGDKRSVSEITALSRFKDLSSMKNKLRQYLEEPEISSNYDDYDDDNDGFSEDIKRRRLWFPIAKRTVQWFANRENNRSQHQHSQNTEEILDV